MNFVAFITAALIGLAVGVYLTLLVLQRQITTLRESLRRETRIADIARRGHDHRPATILSQAVYTHGRRTGTRLLVQHPLAPARILPIADDQ